MPSLSLSRCGLAASRLPKNHPLDALPSSSVNGKCMYLTSSLYIGGSHPAKHLGALGISMKLASKSNHEASHRASTRAGLYVYLPCCRAMAVATSSPSSGSPISAVLQPSCACYGRRMHGWAYQVPSGLERGMEAASSGARQARPRERVDASGSVWGLGDGCGWMGLGRGWLAAAGKSWE